MNTSIDKVSSPQTRRFERGNKQLLLALASVSMLGVAGSVSAITYSITPPASILPTDKQAFFKVAMTGGVVTSQDVAVGCYTYLMAGTTALTLVSATTESAAIIVGVNGGLVTYDSTTTAYAVYLIKAGTSVTANFPVTFAVSGHKQGDTLVCQVSAAYPDVGASPVSLSIGAGAAAQRLRVFDTTSQVTYATTNQVYPAVPPQTSPTLLFPLG